MFFIFKHLFIIKRHQRILNDWYFYFPCGNYYLPDFYKYPQKLVSFSGQQDIKSKILKRVKYLLGQTLG